MANIVFQFSTLVDITATGVVRSTGDNDLERNQQRNFETVLQVLGLRTQPHIVRRPDSEIIPAETVGFLFGEMYTQEPQQVWTFYFSADYPGAYSDAMSPVGNLLKDFEEVPVITGLTETARFMLPIFYPQGAIKNIHLMVYPNK